MSNRSQEQPPESALSQINQLKPIPGLDDAEDVTQRPIGTNHDQLQQPESKQISVMKDVELPSKMSPVKSQMGAIPATNNNSQMGSVMGQSSTMGSVIHPVDFTKKKEKQEPSDTETVFVKTHAVSRPAIVKEPNTWLKKQNINMTRVLPIGIQPGDTDAKKMLHSHTGVPSRLNAKTAVSAAPASSPTPIQPTSHESAAEPSGDNKQHHGDNKQHVGPRKKSTSSHQPRAKKTAQKHQQPVYAKSCPNSPSFGLTPPPSSPHPKEKESAFAKFAKSLLPSTSLSTISTPGHHGEAPTKRARASTNTIQEKRRSKPSKKDSHK